MSVLSNIIVQVVTSATVLGIFIFVIKKYAEKWIAREFEKRSLIDQHNLGQQFKVAEAFLDHRLGIYPEIIELVYRLRNTLRHSLKMRAAHDWSPELHGLFEHLSDNLYKYSLFLSDDIFTKLHRFKGLCKDAVELQKKHSSDDGIFQKEAYDRDVTQFTPKWEEIDVLYQQIKEALKLDLFRQQEAMRYD